MADEKETAAADAADQAQVGEAKAAPASPATAKPAPPRCVVLDEYADVEGESKPKGKALWVSAAEAARLIGEKRAHEASETERRIAGV